ncbi:hypothetical protein CPB84DRAFT_1417047 [Gymnopilus junonius]|uniref:Uncharacterized protein n=1 Tax=Gymnopilus junonius TaxID=109634 RepID=A0A9P5NKW7_GYMJU|nr:hypothetical protein CPB84DRAFT_1417047 [Gymnopilus junonius]
MYFTSNKAISLSVKLKNYNFEFGVVPSIDSPLPRISTERPTHKPTFYINLSSKFPSGSTNSFLTSFANIHFPSCAYLDFRPHPSSGLNERWPEVSAFIKSLSSVETLATVDYGIDVLQKCPEGELIMPSLRKIKLDNATPEDIHWSFLAVREKLGVPVSVLYLSGSQIGDWGFCDNFHGMKVVWKSGLGETEAEYTCGTGEPEKLNFGYLQRLDEELLELALAPVLPPNFQ